MLLRFCFWYSMIFKYDNAIRFHALPIKKLKNSFEKFNERLQFQTEKKIKIAKKDFFIDIRTHKFVIFDSYIDESKSS